MKIAIIGDSTLEAATRKACLGHFEIVHPAEAEIVWICYDTPIDQNDVPDSEFVIKRIVRDAAMSNPDSLILISSQLPVGTTAWLELVLPDRNFAHSPENIRVATAYEDFINQSRIVVGLRDRDRFAHKIRALMDPFTDNLILTDPETAEMVKHALNCYLGMSIAFANEVAKVADAVGADMATITEALRTDRRISPKAPLLAGKPFGGGHLARDIHTVTSLAKAKGIRLPIISNIKKSNES